MEAVSRKRFDDHHHLPDNTGIMYIPHDNNVSMIAPLHPTCNPIKWEMTHVNIQEFIISYPPRKEPHQSDQYTKEIYIYFNLNLYINLTFK
jgi:hypothetical protein